MRALIALAHFSSQIFNKSIRLRSDFIESMKIISEDWYLDWTLRDWERFLKDQRTYDHLFVPSLSALLSRTSMTRTSLAKRAFIQCKSTHENNAQHILLCDRSYPLLLKHVECPPLGFFALGRTDILSKKLISVIGSRRAIEPCRMMSFQIGSLLAENSIGVVSGGALGCDAAVHWGVVRSSSASNVLLVFANSLDDIGPKANQGLFQSALREGGIWLSERLWGSKTMPHHFPQRNRIISALVETVILVQAGCKSGAMLTCNLALDQGREVLVYSPAGACVGTEGNLLLIEQGADSFCQIDELSQMVGLS